MRLLLDTHALLWWLDGDRRLGSAARALIEEPSNAILVSVVALWEIVIKQRIGKLEANIAAIENAIIQDGFIRLDIKPAHLLALSALAAHHRDPFDHLLMAQALAEGAVIVSDDQRIGLYPVQRQTCTG